MTVNIRLTAIREIPEKDFSIASLPFGENEKERLAKIKNGARLSESLSALKCLFELTKDVSAPLDIRRSEYGKPFFESQAAPSFSLSHSKGFAAAAIAEANLGLDIEVIEKRTRLDRIADRFFDPTELRLFIESGGEPSEFFRLWTKKEAEAKLLGTGLSYTRKRGEEKKEIYSRQGTVSMGERLLYVSVCAETPIDKIIVTTDYNEVIL